MKIEDGKRRKVKAITWYVYSTHIHFSNPAIRFWQFSDKYRTDISCLAELGIIHKTWYVYSIHIRFQILQ